VDYRAGSWFSKKEGEPSSQIDLLFVRADKVITLCEVKYTQEKIRPEIITEIDRKIAIFPNKKGYSIEKVLITVSEPTPALVATGYLQHILTVDDLFGRGK